MSFCMCDNGLRRYNNTMVFGRESTNHIETFEMAKMIYDIMNKPSAIAYNFDNTYSVVYGGPLTYFRDVFEIEPHPFVYTEENI